MNVDIYKREMDAIALCSSDKKQEYLENLEVRRQSLVNNITKMQSELLAVEGVLAIQTSDLTLSLCDFIRRNTPVSEDAIYFHFPLELPLLKAVLHHLRQTNRIKKVKNTYCNHE